MPDLEQLESENRALRAEVIELRSRTKKVDESLAAFAADVDGLQAHAAVLENLFVASSRLHASVETPETLRALADILRDLVGARRFGMFLFDEAGELRPILTDGGPASASAPSVVSTDLKLSGHKVGTVVLFELLSQKKNDVTPLDRELLQLIGDQAVSALLAARAFGAQDQRSTMLRDFVRQMVDAREGTG